MTTEILIPIFTKQASVKKADAQSKTPWARGWISREKDGKAIKNSPKIVTRKKGI